MINQAYT